MAVAAAIVCTASLAACSGDDGGTPELIWYINPDAGGQDAVAEACSTDAYTISTQVLPQDSSQQRIQLARRLAAGDPAIDLMSLDPPFTAEFANAGYLAEIPQDMQDKFREQAFDSAATAATWEDELVVAPFWSNTQVLWYRKSFVEKAGIDMEQPVTWDQIIEAASENGGKIGVQANKYEGYSVWINALISGARGPDRVRDREGRRRPDRHRVGRRAGGRPGHRGAGRARRPPPPTSRCPTRAPPAPRSAATRAPSWSTGPTSGATTATTGSATTSASPATPRPSRARSPGRRTAASASA